MRVKRFILSKPFWWLQNHQTKSSNWGLNSFEKPVKIHWQIIIDTVLGTYIWILKKFVTLSGNKFVTSIWIQSNVVGDTLTLVLTLFVHPSVYLRSLFLWSLLRKRRKWPFVESRKTTLHRPTSLLSDTSRLSWDVFFRTKHFITLSWCTSPNYLT